MLDWIESLESAAEKWADINIKDDRFFCESCKRWMPLDVAIPSGSQPYAIPICMECAGLSEEDEL